MRTTITDLVANYASLVVVACSGILINILIVEEFSAERLGVFNLSYAIFVVVSQVSTFGIHSSALKAISLNRDEYPDIFLSALLLAFIISLVVSVMFVFCIPLCSFLFESDEYYINLLSVAAAIVFFSLNKVILFSINALKKMKIFALLQLLRALLILVFIFVLAMRKILSVPLAASFLFSEVVLFFLVLFPIWKKLSGKVCWAKTKEWMAIHFSFGKRVFITGLSIELNTRVDVIVLGIFVSDKLVGLYSFVSMLVEGFYQLLVIVKNNINPLLAKLIHEKRMFDFRILVRRVVIICFCCFSAVATVSAFMYPLAIDMFAFSDELKDVSHIFTILLFFMSLASGWLPFDQILAQAGRPSLSSKLYILGVTTNIILNIILVPVYGMVGAALATGISWVVFVVYLNMASRKYLNVTLLPIAPNWELNK